MTMRQVIITKHGSFDVLQLQECQDPRPEAGQVLIRVRAAGINFADILARKGLYPDAPKPPCVVGYEVSGVIEAVGTGVDPSLVGKAVVALTRFGGYSELVTLPASQLFERPAGLSFEQAAALPVNYLTAYQLLVVMGSLKQGESVLIHNAGGGVGLAALDIAKHMGAITYGTASPGKHEFLKQRGLEHPIDYRTQDWTAVLKQLTEGRGVDLIIDPIGGSHWKKSYQMLRATGRLGMFGISSASESRWGGSLRLLKIVLQTPWFHPLHLVSKNRGVFGVNLGHLWGEGGRVREWMLAILNGVHEGWVHPHVDQAFPFEQAAEAHRYIEERKNMGKVILVP
jgi:NADPH:quinone reductase-like Zn-dependent oxidoreductase